MIVESATRDLAAFPLNVVTRLRSSSFVRDVALLVSGTAIAQAITIAGAPVLSRLYDPTAFGILAVLIAIAGPFSMMASLKYEMAIVLEKRDEDAANLVFLCLFIVIAIVTAAAGLVLFLGEYLAIQLGNPLAAPLMTIIPMQIFIGGTAGVFLFWQTRRRRFGQISAYSVRRSVAVIGLQTGAGLLSVGAKGLVLGRVFGDLFTMIVVVYRVIRDDGSLIVRSFSPSRIRSLARLHSKFPKYNAPRAFIHSFSTSIPSIVLAAFFGPAQVGLYWFTFRLLDMPVHLIGQGIKRVFYQRAVSIHHSGKSLLPILSKTSLTLAGIALFPTLLIILFASPLFAIAFGEEWREAGRFAQWLAINAFSLFVMRPSAMLVPIFELQKFALWVEIIGTTARASAMAIAAANGDAILAIALYSIIGTLFNLGLVGWIFHIAWCRRSSRTKDTAHAD